VLSAAERERVEAVIREAEARTAGEIVVVVARQAASYRSVPLGTALLVALATPWPLIGMTALSATRIFVVQLVLALAAALATSPATWRVRLVPQAIRRRRGREAAQREFDSRGLAGTQGRTGVLLFLAAAERHVEVIADLGISAVVEEAEWRAVIEGLVAALQRGETASGLVGAVERIGSILARHVPPGSRGDELPNRLILL
jgi:putative membrane protein